MSTFCELEQLCQAVPLCLRAGELGHSVGHHGEVGGPPAPPPLLPLPAGRGRPPPRAGEAAEAALLLHRPHHHGHQLQVKGTVYGGLLFTTVSALTSR